MTKDDQEPHETRVSAVINATSGRAGFCRQSRTRPDDPATGRMAQLEAIRDHCASRRQQARLPLPDQPTVRRDL
jgi:hypothetical protein